VGTGGRTLLVMQRTCELEATPSSPSSPTDPSSDICAAVGRTRAPMLVQFNRAEPDYCCDILHAMLPARSLLTPF
jgi:hypothetical protein